MHAKFRKTDSESTQDKTLPDSSVYTFVDEPCGEEPNMNSLTFDKEAAKSKHVTFDTKSSNSNSLSFNTESSNTKSLVFDADSADSAEKLSLTFDTNESVETENIDTNILISDAENNDKSDDKVEESTEQIPSETITTESAGKEMPAEDESIIEKEASSELPSPPVDINKDQIVIQETTPIVEDIYEFVEDVVQQPIVEDVVQQPIVETVVQQPIVEDVVQEPIDENVVQEPIVENVAQQPIVETVPNELIVEAVSEEPIVETVLKEHIIETVSKEPMVEAVLQEPVVEAETVSKVSIVEAIIEESSKAITKEEVPEPRRRGRPKKRISYASVKKRATNNTSQATPENDGEGKDMANIEKKNT